MSASQTLVRQIAADAQAALRNGRFGEALPLVERLALLPAAPPDAASWRAEALFGLQRLDEAEAAADAALNTADAAAQRQLRARIRLARGNATGAADDAAAAVMAAPSDRTGKALLGHSLLELGRHDEAIFFLGAAATEADPPSVLQLAQAFARTGRAEAAAELLAHCEAHWPDLPGLQGTRAQAALLDQRAADATMIARRAIESEGPSPGLLTLLGHALVAIGDLEAAGQAFAAASRLAPGDGYLAHLAAAAGGEPADSADSAYVTRLFDGYAASFERSLVSLGYRVPGLLLRVVQANLPGVAAAQSRLGPVLDLGCGTGLAGVVLDDLLPPLSDRTLVGVDLSPRMLEQAAAKRIYTELRQADIVDALAVDPGRYALITAADVFCYHGRLDVLLSECRARLTPDGLLIFSLELLAEGNDPWRLGRTGRFAHAADYVRAQLDTAGLTVRDWRAEVLRLEGDRPVNGLIIAAGPAPAH